MHTCISSHGLKRSWRSCPRRVNASNKNTPSTHHPRRRNVTTLMVGLKKRSHMQKSHPKVVNPRDIAGERKKKKKKKKKTFLPTVYLLHSCMIVVWWLLHVPAACQCIAGTDLLRQLYMLPHWDRSCRSNFLPHPVKLYWHWANQSQRWLCNARCLAG